MPKSSFGPSDPQWLKRMRFLAGWIPPDGVELNLGVTLPSGVISVMIKACCAYYTTTISPGEPLAGIRDRFRQMAADAIRDRDKAHAAQEEGDDAKGEIADALTSVFGEPDFVGTFGSIEEAAEAIRRLKSGDQPESEHLNEAGSVFEDWMRNFRDGNDG